MKGALLALALLVLGAAAEAQSPSSARLRDLEWLAGTWATSGSMMASGPHQTEEMWMRPGGGMMLGVSREQRGFGHVSFEFLRIEEAADGPIRYWGSPGGRPPVAFTLAELSTRHAAFVNVQHDYPQRIDYRRDGDILIATISLLDGSRPQRWTYRRQP